MRIPTNLSIYAHKNHIELQWDAPNNPGFKYEIVRYAGSFDQPSETVILETDAIVTLKKISFIDDYDLEKGQTYYYTVCYSDSADVSCIKKSIRIQFHPSTPISITCVKLIALSDLELSINWLEYDGDQKSDVAYYEVFVELFNFHNVSDLTPKLIINKKICAYKLLRPESCLYVAVVPVGINKQKILGVTPTEIKDLWSTVKDRSPDLFFSILPAMQFEKEEMLIQLSFGEPNSLYHIIIGDVIASKTLSTNNYGHGRVTIEVPLGVGPGRHSIILDNGFGSKIMREDVFLVPIRLSPTLSDTIDNVPDVNIVSGFDTSIVDKIRFTQDDSVSFRFRKGKSPEDLKLNICKLLATLFTGALISTSGQNSLQINVPIRTLPSFSYPPFLHNAYVGSLNLFGLVQNTKFKTVGDWLEHINEFHEYFDGMPKVVRSISEFNPETQQFGLAVIDTGPTYEGDYELTPGRSYLIEVKEPINNYCIAADGFVEFAYLPLFSTSSGSLNSIVIVADGRFDNAESWATEINMRHFETTEFDRVVSSVTPWSADQQVYGEALIDIGSRYEGNFGLVRGKGYIVEVKQAVSNFVLTGESLAEEVC